MAARKAAEKNPDVVEDETPVRVDRVVAVSYKADGTPDQGEGFVVIGDESDTDEA